MWMDLLQWALPSGFIGALITWMANRGKRETDSLERLLDALNRQSDDISNLYKELGYIRRAVEKRNACRYLAMCPVDVELRKTKGFNQQSHSPRERQREGDGNYNSEAIDGTVIAGKPPPGFEGDHEPDPGGDIHGEKRASIHPGREAR